MSASLPRLILATRNAHKTSEIRAMVGDQFQILDATAFPDWPVIEETGDTFLQNATLKAVGISSQIDGWVLADDSGLEVDALGGAPGVISSSYGGVEGDHARNNERLLREMRGIADRRARFRCTMVWAKDGIARANFTGTVEGRILDETRGAHGFGYDPVFAPEDESKSFAELGDAVKHVLSHRSLALAQAVAWLEAQQDCGAAQFD